MNRKRENPGPENLRLAFAGGGTGGHIFPALALAAEFTRREPQARVVFFGGRRGLDARLIPARGYELRRIEVEALKGRGLPGQLRSLGKLPGALGAALAALRELRPHLVIGLGGYASGPVLLSAFLLRLPRVIVEPNAIPGLANRLAGRLAQRIFTAHPETEKFFPRSAVRCFGNPLRPEVLPGPGRVPPERNGFTLLVLGGSQGAKGINANLRAGLPELDRGIPGLRVVHQTGAADREQAEKDYRESGGRFQALEFIEDMGRAYAGADLVIARAGATTLAELTAWGKPAILVPYPFAADQHQRENARALAAGGAAVMLEETGLSGPALAAAVLELYRDQSRRERMGARARELARPEARERIVDECQTLWKR